MPRFHWLGTLCMSIHETKFFFLPCWRFFLISYFKRSNKAMQWSLLMIWPFLRYVMNIQPSASHGTAFLCQMIIAFFHALDSVHRLPPLRLTMDCILKCTHKALFYRSTHFDGKMHSRYGWISPDFLQLKDLLKHLFDWKLV